ncbi:MAG: hypothetical protein RBR02_06850 [Desulfuromonadaceae bacterium]|nr:hypothetical protein [Desulfuromonadaceae bacterium]
MSVTDAIVYVAQKVEYLRGSVGNTVWKCLAVEKFEAELGEH